MRELEPDEAKTIVEKIVGDKDSYENTVARVMVRSLTLKLSDDYGDGSPYAQHGMVTGQEMIDWLKACEEAIS